MRYPLTALIALSLLACPSPKEDKPPELKVVKTEPLGVQLPTTLPPKITTKLKVRLKDKGALYLDGQPTNQEALKRALEDSLKKNADTAMIISATKDVPHGKVIELIDQAKLLGVKHFSIEASPPQ